MFPVLYKLLKGCYKEIKCRLEQRGFVSTRGTRRHCSKPVKLSSLQTP